METPVKILFRYPRKEDGEPCWTTDIDRAKSSILYWKQNRRSILESYVTKFLSVKTELNNTLMDDLAWSIYEYLLDESTDFRVNILCSYQSQ